MTEYDDTNRGALFKNDKKESDKHPDYKGMVNVDGKDYWLSAWINKSAAGRTYMSLSVQVKETQGGGGDSSGQAGGVPDGGYELDQEIPF